MQRIIPPPQLNSFSTKYKNQTGNTDDYYRFYILPINPVANYSVKNGKLNFRYLVQRYNPIIDDKGGEEWISNKFNIQAVFATSYQAMLETVKSRSMPETLLKENLMVVDINKKYFDEKAVFYSGAFKESYRWGNFSTPSISSTEESYKTKCLANRDEYYISYPVYSQTFIIITDHNEIITHKKSVTNDLFQYKNQVKFSHLEVFVFGKDDENNNIGNDIFLSKSAPVITSSYRRKIDGLSDWISYQQKNINKTSYLHLTGQLKNESGNAVRVASLFVDYAKKGRGLSALLHCHLFRHKDNIQQAEKIAQELLKDEFKNANNIEVAEFLARQFEALQNVLQKKGIPFNLTGSFARRINYAILQLTNGICQSVKGLRNYQSQNESLYLNSQKL